MAKVRLNIEIEDKVYEQYKEKFNKIKSAFPLMPLTSVEDFIASSLETMQNMDTKMADLTKKLNIDLVDILEKSGADLTSITEVLKKTKTDDIIDEEDEKKENFD
ncbi:MAG: hypothetical protein LBV53_02210 [Mycoplasmataceae bacterium]|jgi:hypothetical protein|nr:hypothetical protein [Mycoplasmataceae bacterium]